MNITLKRIRHRPETIDGQIWIDGEKVCCSAENNKLALASGTYPITLVKCHQHTRKMPVVISHSVSESHSNHPDGKPSLSLSLSPPCETCPKLSLVCNNTTMPMICPQICPGNGVYNRTDGSIIVGRYLAPGCLTHPKSAFDALYERIRKNLERGNPVSITITSI